jgi:type IV conjugative transfer system lipoprotein TraV
MRKIIPILLLFIISACSSTTKDTWDCPLLEGGKGSCVSIKDSDLWGSVEEKKSTFDFLNSPQKIEINLVAPKFKDIKKLKQYNPKSEYLSDSGVNKSSKLRTREKIGKIWLAPHIDSEGNQHSEKVIYVVDEEAKWVGQR